MASIFIPVFASGPDHRRTTLYFHRNVTRWLLPVDGRCVALQSTGRRSGEFHLRMFLPSYPSGERRKTPNLTLIITSWGCDDQADYQEDDTMAEDSDCGR